MRITGSFQVLWVAICEWLGARARNLGNLQSIKVKDDAVLIVQGENGTIRMDLLSRQLFELLAR